METRGYVNLAFSVFPPEWRMEMVAKGIQFLVIDALAANPRPRGTSKLRGSSDLFRICIGDYLYCLRSSFGSTVKASSVAVTGWSRSMAMLRSEPNEGTGHLFLRKPLILREADFIFGPLHKHVIRDVGKLCNQSSLTSRLLAPEATLHYRWNRRLLFPFLPRSR
jgi:hypothetical protein